MTNLNKEFKPRYAVISASAASANEIVAAKTGKKIRVIAYTLNAAGGANTCTFKSATTAISGAMDVASDATMGAESSPYGVLETAEGEALNLTLSAATLVAGHITYVLS